jgi:hypothetical protein
MFYSHSCARTQVDYTRRTTVGLDRPQHQRLQAKSESGDLTEKGFEILVHPSVVDFNHRHDSGASLQCNIRPGWLLIYQGRALAGRIPPVSGAAGGGPPQQGSVRKRP